MSCNSCPGNQVPYQGQLYRYTYPEKNAQWWSPIPDNCTRERKKECCQRALYTPSRANKCASTFEPNSRPDPYQCLKMCKGIDALKVNQCQAEQMQRPRKISTNGCLMEPSIASYSNVPMNKYCLKGACKSESILTNPLRQPPNPPETDNKYSNAYDPFLIYGNAYTY